MAQQNGNNNGQPRETTSIRIDPQLWKEARLYALKNDVSIGELVEKLLRKELKK